MIVGFVFGFIFGIGAVLALLFAATCVAVGRGLNW